MNPKMLREGKPEGGQATRAKLTDAEIFQAVKNLHSPVTVFAGPYAGKTHPDDYKVPKGSVIMLLDQVDSEGMPLFASVHPNHYNSTNMVTFNKVATAFGKTGADLWVNSRVTEQQVLSGENRAEAVAKLKNVIKKGSERLALESSGGTIKPLPSSSTSQSSKPSDVNLPQQDAPVKPSY